MKKTHSLNELDQLKMLSESIVRIEEDAGFEIGSWVKVIDVNALDSRADMIATYVSLNGEESNKFVFADTVGNDGIIVRADEYESYLAAKEDEYEFGGNVFPVPLDNLTSIKSEKVKPQKMDPDNRGAYRGMPGR